ncbi:response regulator [Porphyrobacter algicida]|uniref:Response regulator n=1 Tax=Qipengyuania algicida TaxID=1836209 RepID=A0A845AT34_9SPHN|nr:response regulator transcription factor [Qipengyuania algicida]MXP30028.1 response regulator [Qipengyuania algicida]
MRILIAEDDSETAGYVSRGLSEAGHSPVVASDGRDALHLALTEDFDLMILDRMMPGIDGIEVLRRARAGGIGAPAIMLTALGRIEDRVEGLDAGADDYLLKPFAFSELIARVNAISRRSAPQHAVTKISNGPFEIDLLAREVRRDGEPVILQPKEFRLFEELMKNAGEFVTRTMLLERVWDFHFDPQTKIVETHVSRLRAKLNEGGRVDWIETARGVGYRMRAG